MTRVKASFLIDAAVILVSVAVFVAIASYHLNLPGLYNDEAMDVVGAMQLLKGQTVELQRGAGLSLGGINLPLMNSDYQGVVSTYLVIPFFALLGVSTVSLRLMTIAVGVAALVLTYFVGKALFNRPTALLSVVLLAVFPSFIFWSRVGIYVVSEVVPLSLGSLLCFIAWWRKGKEPYLYAGFFLLGIGLSTKLLFLWYILALLGTAVVMNAPAFLRWYRQRGLTAEEQRSEGLPPGWARLLSSPPRRLLRYAGVGPVTFAAGAFPFLLYNVMTRGTYLVLRSNLATSDRGVSNAAFFPNLLTELDALKVLLDGSYFWFQGGIFTNPLYPALFAVSGVALIPLVIWVPALRRYRASVSLILVLMALVVLQSCFTVSGLWATHLLILVPLPQILIAAFFSLLYTAVREQVSARKLIREPKLAQVNPFFSGDDLTSVRTEVDEVTSVGLGAPPLNPPASGGRSENDALKGRRLPPRLRGGPGRGETRGTASERVSPNRRTARLVLGLLLSAIVVASGLLVTMDLKVDAQYHQALEKSGGYYSFSDAVYGLASYLDSQKASEPAAMDWGIKPAIQILTEGRVNPKEVYGFEPGAEAAFYDRLQMLLADPNRLYLFHTDESSAYPRFAAFNAAVEKAGKRVILEKTFFHRDGKPIYLVYRVD